MQQQATRMAEASTIRAVPRVTDRSRTINGPEAWEEERSGLLPVRQRSTNPSAVCRT